MKTLLHFNFRVIVLITFLLCINHKVTANDGLSVNKANAIVLNNNFNAFRAEINPTFTSARFDNDGYFTIKTKKITGVNLEADYRISLNDDSTVIEYTNKEITIQYLNNINGLRQNYIINKASGRNTIKIVQELSFSGKANFDTQNGIIVQFNGSTYQYSDLIVWDKSGNKLPSYFELIDSQPGKYKIALVVDASNAAFPITIDPNLGLFQGELFIAQNTAKYAASFSTAGDIQMDGYDDLLVGAYKFDNGQVDEGVIYAYFGNIQGLKNIVDWDFEINQAYAQLGYQVVGNRDINNDGFTDLIASANLYDNGQSDEGIVYMFLGSAEGFSETPSWSYESNNATANLGTSIDFAGDINNDGYEDVIIGAPNFDMAVDEGKVFVFYGNAAGLPTTPSWSKFGYASNRFMGSLVRGVGDLNNDGYDDVIIMERSIIGNSHILYAFHGSASGLNTSYSWTKTFNYTLTSLEGGDINHDNFNDIIISLPLLSEGTIYCFNGSSTGLSATSSWQKSGGLYLGELGYGLAICDVNNDGLSELAVSDCILKEVILGDADYYHDIVKVFPGIATGIGIDTANYYAVESKNYDYNFGRTLDFCDYNGDSYFDLIIGNPESLDHPLFGGSIQLVQNSPVGLFGGKTNFFFEETADANLGFSLSNGDINGDNISDLIASAPNQIKDSIIGVTYVIYGKNGLIDFDLNSDPSDSTWQYINNGYHSFSIGDVNGDGYEDIGVGHEYYSNDFEWEGAFMTYHGSESGIINIPATIIEGNSHHAYFGEQFTSGDFNNDGFDDVIIISLYAYYAAYYSGSATGLLSTPSLILEIDNAASICSPGDFNADGYDDLIIGFGSYSSNTGKVHFYPGSASGLPLVPTETYIGAHTDYNAGEKVVACGDINGDGFADFASGSKSFDDGQNYEGAFYVFYGSASGSIANPVIIQSDIESMKLGYVIGAAGDVNNDGYNDMLVANYDPGDVRLYFGSEYGIDAFAYLTLNDENTFLSDAGDLNNDGFDDFAIADHTFSPYGTKGDAGSVLIYYGGLNINNNLYCGMPSGLNASTILPESAIISWTENPDIDQYLIRWKKIDDIVWQLDTSVVSFYEILALEPCITYQVQLSALCNPTPSSWTPVFSFSSYCITDCELVTVMQVDSTTLIDLFVSWTEPEIAESYILDYKKFDAITWNTISVPVNHVMLTLYYNCTDYNFRIRTVCSADTTDYSPVFTLESNCPPCNSAPDGVYANSITTNSVKVHWDLELGATNYKVYYRKSGTVAWAKKSSTSVMKKLNGLTPGTTYEYKVRSECPDGVISPFSPTQTFTTLPLKSNGSIVAETTITLYPNPNKGVFKIDCNVLPETEILIEITDIVGAKIFTETFSPSQVVEIETLLPKGVYVVMIKFNSLKYYNSLVIQ